MVNKKAKTKEQIVEANQAFVIDLIEKHDQLRAERRAMAKQLAALDGKIDLIDEIIDKSDAITD